MTMSQSIRRELTATCRSDILGKLSRRTPSGARQAFGRLANILALLQTGERFNAATLAKANGKCTKTTHRDLDWLRSQGVDLIFDGSRKTYQIKPGSPVPPLIQLAQVI